MQSVHDQAKIPVSCTAPFLYRIIRRESFVKAIAVLPGQADSVHLTRLDQPSVNDVSSGRGVLVEVIQVGVDGTDKEINAAEYGAAPPGYEFLVIGHEIIGSVV